MLDVIGFDLCLSRDSLEGHGTVVWWSLENGLCQSCERDLLIQESFVLFKQGVLADVSDQSVVGKEIATVESEEQVTQPGVWCT
jgi:hypothetical protein